MPDELNMLRDLRPDVEGAAPATVEGARQVLAAEIACESSGRRNGWRHSRWLVPCFVVAMFGAGGLAAAGLSDWWTDADPPVRQSEVESLLAPDTDPTNTDPRNSDPTNTDPIVADLDRLRTVARAPGATLLAAPVKDSQKNYCIAWVPDGGQIERACHVFEGDVSNELFMTWVHKFDEATAWYLMGRLSEPGAERITLFEEMTYPLDVDDARRGPDEPVSFEVGPGGFFLARIPEPIWPSLELGYSSFSVLDAGGDVIRRSCLFFGVPPPSPYAETLTGHPRPFGVQASDPESCPATGSYVATATMRLATNVRDDWGGFAGEELASHERVELESFSGRPVLAVVWEPGGLRTSGRLFTALNTFAQRHPEAQVVVVADKRRAQVDGMEDLLTAKSRARSIPILLGDVPWASVAEDRLLLVALGPDGSAKAQLVPSANEILGSFSLVSQDLLDELLATTE